MHNKQINLIASREPQEDLLVMFFLLMVVPAPCLHQSDEFTPILLSQLSYICRLFLSRFFSFQIDRKEYMLLSCSGGSIRHMFLFGSWIVVSSFVNWVWWFFSYAFVGMLLLSTPDENRKRKRKAWGICTIEIKGTRKDDSGEGFVVSKSCSLHLVPQGLLLSEDKMPVLYLHKKGVYI